MPNEELQPGSGAPLHEIAAIPLPTEIFQLRHGDRLIEVTNYHEALAPEEQFQLESAFGAISGYTGGKIFDRVTSVELNRPEQFDDPEVQGDYDLESQQIRINMELARHPHKTFESFREKFFSNRPITALQFNLVHEAGHAMDLQYLEEIEAHGINKEAVAPGWRSHGGKSRDFSAFAHPDSPAVNQEPRVTPRAEEGAREDFADSFAVAVLGGNVTAIPNKLRRLQETISLAKGHELDDAQVVQFKKAA